MIRMELKTFMVKSSTAKAAKVSPRPLRQIACQGPPWPFSTFLVEKRVCRDILSLLTLVDEF